MNQVISASSQTRIFFPVWWRRSRKDKKKRRERINPNPSSRFLWIKKFFSKTKMIWLWKFIPGPIVAERMGKKMVEKERNPKKEDCLVRKQFGGRTQKMLQRGRNIESERKRERRLGMERERGRNIESERKRERRLKVVSHPLIHVSGRKWFMKRFTSSYFPCLYTTLFSHTVFYFSCIPSRKDREKEMQIERERQVELNAPSSRLRDLFPKRRRVSLTAQTQDVPILGMSNGWHTNVSTRMKREEERERGEWIREREMVR